MTLTAGTPASRRLTAEGIAMRAAILALVAFLLLAIACPLATLLSKSVQDGEGRFVGLANYARYFSTPALVDSLWNSTWVAALSTLLVVPPAFIYAYAIARACIPGKSLFTALALLPLFAPSLLSAISLIYIFGNQGLLKGWLMGGTIYGPFSKAEAEDLARQINRSLR